jgi:uncharacterized protein (DUF2336 family)
MTIQNAFINELEDALSHGSGERRVKALRRVTDLFVLGANRFSSDQIAVFDTVFSHLIVNMERSARAMLAERLATLPQGPPEVMRQLAFDDVIEVAGPVLSHSEALDNSTLVENARTKSQQHLLAISRRKTLADTVTDVLVERGDREVALSTVRNAGAVFSEIGYVRLVKRSEGDDELAQSLGTRPEIPRQHFLKLLATASKTVRLTLEAAHPGKASEIQRVVTEVATAIQTKAAAVSRDFAEARAVVDALRASRGLSEADVETFAQTGKFEETAVVLANLSALPIDLVERAMVQEREETILLVMKAIGLSWSTAKTVLLLCAGEGGLSSNALEERRLLFNRLKQSTAQQVVEFQRKRQRPPSAG